MKEDNPFRNVNHNRLEKAMGVLLSSVYGVEIKVKLTPKQKELAATSSIKQK
ncbi:MAG: hypothetical protein HFF36_10595 [Coprobacillus sp.]|nr:hypothetical protein [Coprobacillus sp.]